MTGARPKPHSSRTELLSVEEFTAALRSCGNGYWDRHPFHLRLREGDLTETEIRAWVANRWLYQKCLPQKNAALIANCSLPDVRRKWLERITFHDGTVEGEGGMADWLRLADAVGLSREEVLDERYAVASVRFAVDGYVGFVRARSWVEGAAAALTELFAPDAMRDRVVAFERHYPWIAADGLAYFTNRIPVVSADSDFTLDLVLRHCRTREQQEAALAALSFKCDVLWAMVDAIEHAASCPRWRSCG